MLGKTSMKLKEKPEVFDFSFFFFFKRTIF